MCVIRWEGLSTAAGMHAGAQVIAKAYDNPIPGYKTNTVGNLRLWEALPVSEFNLDAFNKGEYDKVPLPMPPSVQISVMLAGPLNGVVQCLWCNTAASLTQQHLWHIVWYVHCVAHQHLLTYRCTMRL